jgi:hypothetical protein
MSSKIWAFVKTMYKAALEDIQDYPRVVFWILVALTVWAVVRH